MGYILWSFWYIFPRFGMLYHEKSGNPVILSLASEWNERKGALFAKQLPFACRTKFGSANNKTECHGFKNGGNL
jgi:hypothetical protein